MKPDRNLYSYRTREEDYFLILGEKKDIADALKKLEELATTELQMSTASTYADIRDGVFFPAHSLCKLI